MEFTALSDHTGVLVAGLDLEAPIAPDDAKALRKALDDNKILLFRQGPVSDEAHVRLLASLGRIMHEEDETTEITYVANSKDAYVTGAAGLRFHSDWQCAVSGGIQLISLYAVEMEHDDPTIYANMAYAVKAIPAEVRAKVEHLNLVQCTDFSGATPIDGQFRLSAQGADVPDELYPRSIHPLIGKHRITGEEVLNVSQQQTSHIDGMTEDESDKIFAELAPYQYGDQNLYQHHWEVNDLLIWDNIALQHARNANTAPSGRRLRRVAVNEIDFAQMFPDVPEAVTMMG